MGARRGLGCVAGLVLASVALGQALAETVVVRAARMLDVQTGQVVESPEIVITDGRIASLGRTGQAAVPADVRVVDLGPLTILPGLIDMHVHLTAVPTIGGYGTLNYTDSFWSVMGVPNARATVEAGFTAVRNVGSEDFADVGLMQAIDDGFIPGPRIVPAAYAIGATGGHCDDGYYPPSMQQTGPGVADGPEELRKRVRWARKYGAEVIKICATGGVFDPGKHPGTQEMTQAEIAAVVDEAHMLGLRVAAHAHGADGIRAAILGGVDTVEHASLIDEAGIRLAREKGVWLSMDIYNSEYTQAEGKKNGVLEDSLRKDREIAGLQRENFRRALKAGDRMVFGTDAGIFPHGENARQFAWMVRYGMTPMQAIQSATVNAAKALDREADVGAIAVGRYGDIIAVAGNPLADVTVLEHVLVVIKGGAIVKDAR